MYSLEIIKDKKKIDITNFAGKIELSTSLDSLGAAFSFELARNYSDDNFSIIETIETGSIILFSHDDVELFQGIITELTTGKYNKTINCLDFAFYLNNNEVIKQFKNISASDAIKQLLTIVGVPVGEIENIPTMITKIYRGDTIAEIIDDILNQATNETGNKYRYEIIENEFNLGIYKKIKVEYKYKFTGAIEKTESIVDMKNSILVTSNNEKDVNTLGEAKDQDNITKYGKLQKVMEVEPKDVAKVRNIASKKLEELNKVFTSATLSLYGSDEMKASRVINITNEEFGLDTDYLITSCTHTYEKWQDIASIDLEVI